MRTSIKAAIAIAAGALLLAGCADYPYDDYGYNGYGYNNAPYYDSYPGYYTGPAIGFGFGYSAYDHHDWHEHEHEHEHHWHDR